MTVCLFIAMRSMNSKGRYGPEILMKSSISMLESSAVTGVQWSFTLSPKNITGVAPEWSRCAWLRMRPSTVLGWTCMGNPGSLVVSAP